MKLTPTGEELKPEQLRIIDNTEQFYGAWLEAQREQRTLPRNMYWKTVGKHVYLYHVAAKGSASATSLGPRNQQTEQIWSNYQHEISNLKRRVEGATQQLSMATAQYRALKLPQILPLPARILRELDVRGHLGADFLVVGTNAFGAYEIAARERFAQGLDETEDFDLSWCRGSTIANKTETDLRGSPLLNVLKHIDSTFRMSKERLYQAINDDVYEVELLAAPSVQKTLSPDETFSPIPLPEQEWLLLGKPIRHVVCARDGSPAPLHVPDPRWMALHKIWLSRKETRKATKRPKDARQGELLLSAVARKMQDSHPLDLDFVLTLPEELLPIFNEWSQKTGYVPSNGTSPAKWF